MPQSLAPAWHIARDAYTKNASVGINTDELVSIHDLKERASETGDQLFLFVCYECADAADGVSSEQRQLAQMRRAMLKAVSDLNAVIRELEDRID